MRRIVLTVAVAATLAIPAGVAVVGAASQASAAGLACNKLKGSTTGAITVLKCAVPKADKKTYKSAGAPNAAALATGGTLHWTTSGTTTVVGKPTLTAVAGAPRCAKKSTEEIANGTITGGTSAVTHAGDHFRADVCIKGTKIKNAKGTAISL